ncbi:hypothetical protein BH11ARM1_BH11ARM1_04700 [soil metagenome]
MFSLVALSLLAPTIAPPTAWANDFAPAGSIPYVIDLNGDGFADLVRIVPGGDAFIDIAINGAGQKCQVPQRALSNWGKDGSGGVVAMVDGKAAVLGLFGSTVRIATDFEGTAFKKNDVWVTVPNGLAGSKIGLRDDHVLVWSPKSGDGVSFDLKTKASAKVKLPKNTEWIGEGDLSMQVDRKVFQGSTMMGEMTFGRPVLVGKTVFVSRPTASAAALPSQDNGYFATGDMDHDGDQDMVQFRMVDEPHFGSNVVIHRTISPGETDSDCDGLSNADEAKLGTDPLNPDTDNDTLLDGWEVGTYRDLDMKALGCDPRHVDLICLISPFENLDEKFMKEQMGNVIHYYTTIESLNPDGTKGWNLHPIYLAKVTGADMSSSWQANREKFRPAKWKGVVHWMQESPNGGGQADQLGDGGGCGGGGWALYATFIHEFGHQIGLSHEGFYDAAWCPTYPSLMNYAYSYTYEGDIRNVRYSDGRLEDYKINEKDLSEVIPLPYEKLKFLEQAPYRYQLKAAGDKTLIDWNWNGIFGEEHIRADINYAYSTTAGRRDNVGKTQSAPWLFTSGKSAYALFSRHGLPADKATDPTVSLTKPGSLIIRKLIQPYKWEDEQVLIKEGITGDPVATSLGDQMFFGYQTAKGVQLRLGKAQGKLVSVGEPVLLDSDGAKVPSFGLVSGRLMLALWDPATKRSTYQWWDGKAFGSPHLFGFLSTISVGIAEDTLKHQVLLGSAFDQDDKRSSRWQLHRYRVSGDLLLESSKEWIEGDKGGSRGNSRCTLLFDADKNWGPDGKIYFFGLGLVSEKSPWSCAFVAETLGDKTVNSGWRVKRYYDEWTQSRSAPAAALFGDDIIYGYRWADGSQGDGDNILHVAYRGSGIEPTVMGDFNDIKYMRDFGIRYSLLYMSE